MATAFRLEAGSIVDERLTYDALHLLKSSGLSVLYSDCSNAQDESCLLLDGIVHVLAAHKHRRIIARLEAGRDAKEAQHGQAARA